MARTKTCARLIGGNTVGEKRFRTSYEIEQLRRDDQSGGGAAGEDRFSALPDELIHKILSFVDVKLAVQMSMLSRRWRHVWTTLPFLNFGRYKHTTPTKITTFFRKVLAKRNTDSHLLKLTLHLWRKLPGDLFEKYIKYALSHSVQILDVNLSIRHDPYNPSTFSSSSLLNLTLCLKLEQSMPLSNCWDLPSLTTLHLKCPADINQTISESCLTCLPSLITLCLDGWDLRKSSLSFNLPNLTTLRMSMCTLPETIWNFPALKTLEFNDVLVPDNMRTILSTLVSLENLTLFFQMRSIPDCLVISCSELVNLYIGTRHMGFLIGNQYKVIRHGKIMVVAPKLRNFSSLGIFPITFGVRELETATVKLHGWIGDMHILEETQAISEEELEKYYESFTFMFQGLGGARILILDSESIEALSEISDFLGSFPSPFRNLKYVKLPDGYRESVISGAVRSYLLGGSPGATIVTTLPQFDDVQEKDVVGNSVDDVQTYVVENSVVDVDMVSKSDDAPFEKGAGSARVNSLNENRGLGLWRGYEVNREFVCLLDLIMNKYPETFEHFLKKINKLGATKLNMLCTSLNDFTKTSMTEVTTEMIAEYRDVFAELETMGFNVSWILSRLNYIEHIRFSQPLISELHAIDRDIDDGKRRLQDVETCVDAKTMLQDPQSSRQSLELWVLTCQNRRVEKLTEIQNAFGTMATNLAVGDVGDGLLSQSSGCL